MAWSWGNFAYPLLPSVCTIDGFDKAAMLVDETVKKISQDFYEKNTFLIFQQVPVVQKVDTAIHWINHYPLDITLLVSLILIRWIAIYLAPVVQKVDSTIRRINHYPVDNAISFRITYPLDSDLSGG